MAAGQKKEKDLKTCVCVEDSDVDSLGLKGSPEVQNHLWAGRLQAHCANHHMGGCRADFKRVLGEGWAVNTSTGNSALLSENVLSLELSLSALTHCHISLET